MHSGLELGTVVPCTTCGCLCRIPVEFPRKSKLSWMHICFWAKEWRGSFSCTSLPTAQQSHTEQANLVLPWGESVCFSASNVAYKLDHRTNPWFLLCLVDALVFNLSLPLFPVLQNLWNDFNCPLGLCWERNIHVTDLGQSLQWAHTTLSL